MTKTLSPINKDWFETIRSIIYSLRGKKELSLKEMQYYIEKIISSGEIELDLNEWNKENFNISSFTQNSIKFMKNKLAIISELKRENETYFVMTDLGRQISNWVADVDRFREELGKIILQKSENNFSYFYNVFLWLKQEISNGFNSIRFTVYKRELKKHSNHAHVQWINYLLVGLNVIKKSGKGKNIEIILNVPQFNTIFYGNNVLDETIKYLIRQNKGEILKNELIKKLTEENNFQLDEIINRIEKMTDDHVIDIFKSGFDETSEKVRLFVK